MLIYPIPQSSLSTLLRQLFGDFLVPPRYSKVPFDYTCAKICIIVPTYAPVEMTRTLVADLVRFNPRVYVYVVDDCTPPEFTTSVQIMRSISALVGNITVVRTPLNRLKAGALNFGLRQVYEAHRDQMPDVIITLDDDVVIEAATIENLVKELMTCNALGAVCSQSRVFNKNKNILTRLQGLEYLGFNATRLADEGFFRGPLVMHGMLTAFRASALRAVDGFAEGHLIEDYEVTMRLKAHGWDVKSSLHAHAWTSVPETISQLWRQRTRWSYGGLLVVGQTTSYRAVLQDLIGHTMFWANIVMIDLLILCSVFNSFGDVPPSIANWIIILSYAQLAVIYFFQLWLMTLYKDSDVYDWVIRITLIPEFIYANVLSLILVGSYAFLFFNILTQRIVANGGKTSKYVVSVCHKIFRKCGYVQSWGTRIPTSYAQF